MLIGEDVRPRSVEQGGSSLSVEVDAQCRIERAYRGPLQVQVKVDARDASSAPDFA